MINYFYETGDPLKNEMSYSNWVSRVILSEEKSEGEICFIFCDDEYLLEINQKFLNHNTYTDIISFDNSMGNLLSGDIYISLERVIENAKYFRVDVEEERRRVMIHGILHFCGYKDKLKKEKEIMRTKEDEKLRMFHVEHS